MIIDLEYIENILKDINSFEKWPVNLDAFGNKVESGSFEFELQDSEDRLWGGRIIQKDEETYQLVEFFSKMFYSDYRDSDWDNFADSDDDVLDRTDDW